MAVDMDIKYEVIHSKRKTIMVTVERDCSIVVRAPEGVDADKVAAVVESKKLWLYEKLKNPQKYSQVKKTREFVSGEAILYLGKNYRLAIKKNGNESIYLNGKYIVTGTTSDHASQLFRDWYIQKANEQILPRVERYANNMGVEFNEAKISNMRYRWGSCTPKDNLNFNWKLIKAPIYAIDYVIVHELAHLLEHNHTTRFWNIIRTQVPEYLKAKTWLKEHGEVLDHNL
jgi:predicted metal-dependent hydrolase